MGRRGRGPSTACDVVGAEVSRMVKHTHTHTHTEVTNWGLAERATRQSACTGNEVQEPFVVMLLDNREFTTLGQHWAR